MNKTLVLASLLAVAPAVSAQNYTTLFVGTTFLTAPATLYFDLQVTNPAGIVVNGLDINSNSAPGTVGTCTVWRTAAGSTYVGNERVPGVWTQLSGGSVTSGGTNVPATVALSNAFYLPAGTYGFALHHVGLNPIYTNPASVTPTPPLTFSNADISTTHGRGRSSLATDPFGGTSLGSAPRIANINLRYTVGSLLADFVAAATTGPSPLTVQFTDTSFSGNGGVTAWAWDVDGDNNVDYTTQHPVHTYNACGNYTVSLTVTDLSGSETRTRTNYIQTDRVTPGFTWQFVGPDTLQFTDTTSPAPGGWAWDLDGDNLVDSTLQNPSFTYPAGCGPVNVTLTVSNVCQSYSLTRRVVVANTLQTRFDGSTITVSGATGGANFFDLTVSNPLGVTVCALDVHSNVPAGGTVGVNVHIVPGTYLGNEATPAAWRQIAGATATSAGLGSPTYVAFPGTFYLPAGTYGVCVEQIGNSPVYINVGGTQTFSNADLSLTAGATQAEPVFGAGTIFTPRIWNGAFHYTTCTVTGDAGYGYFAPGCAGSLGVPGNVGTSLPRLGNTMSADLTNLPQNAAFFVLGFSRTSSVFGPLPLDLGLFGAPGCPARVSPDATLLILGTGGTASYSLALPNIPGLLCGQFYTQGLALDAAANAAGFVSSDAAAALIGQ